MRHFGRRGYTPSPGSTPKSASSVSGRRSLSRGRSDHWETGDHKDLKLFKLVDIFLKTMMQWCWHESEATSGWVWSFKLIIFVRCAEISQFYSSYHSYVREYFCDLILNISKSLISNNSHLVILQWYYIKCWGKFDVVTQYLLRHK